MLSYQHAYHAGCLADVHKHTVLLHVLEALKARDPQLAYIDTHSGRGLYRLDSPEAEKTGEAKTGIMLLEREDRLKEGQILARKLKELREKHGKLAYPGSPMLAQMALRPQDKLHLFELHPAEHAALLKNLRGHNVRVYKQDGYAGALQLSPPPPMRKGLVLVDPSYEVKDEYLEVARFVRALLRKWPEAVMLIWYPMLKAQNHLSMVEALEKGRWRGYWHQPLQFCDPETVRGMYGSGIIGINLPAGLPEKLDAAVKEVF